MVIPRSYIEEYSKRLTWLSNASREKLEEALGRIDMSAPTDEQRYAVKAVMQRMCGASATVSARLAADFYDGLRARFGIDDGFTAEVTDYANPSVVGGAVDEIFDEITDADQIAAKCSDRIDYMVRRSANECIAHNARRDPRRPRWARVPVGVCTCDWCIMLASRGFAYGNDENAGHTHANCDCRIVPSWDKEQAAVEGYDPEYYYDCYRNPDEHPEIREAQNARRRELYADRKQAEQGRSQTPS